MKETGVIDAEIIQPTIEPGRDQVEGAQIMRKEAFNSSNEIETLEARPVQEAEQDPFSRFNSLNDLLAETESRKGELVKYMQGNRSELSRVREELGLTTPGEEDSSTRQYEQELDTIDVEFQKVSQEKESFLTSAMREAVNFLEGNNEEEFRKRIETLVIELRELPPEQVQIILQTGKMPNGKEIENPLLGKLDPELAKEVAKLAVAGVEITLAAIKTVGTMFLNVASKMLGGSRGGEAQEAGNLQIGNGQEASPATGMEMVKFGSGPVVKS